MNKGIKVSPFGLGLTYAGCFFGAGYISGKELFEFFGSFGVQGFVGLILSNILFFIFGVLLLKNVKLSGKTSFDEVIILKNMPIARFLLGFMTIFMMFGIFVVMAAGAGALLNKVLNIPTFFGCLIFILICCFAALFGIGGAIKFFSAIIPVLLLSTLTICAFSLCKFGLNIDNKVSNDNPLLINWFFSAFTYVSYNMVTLIGTMIPVGTKVNDNKTIFSGIAIGCLTALSIAGGILLTVTSVFGASNEELPMLEIAFKVNNIFGYVYAVLLLLAMFGTSLSSIVAINVYTEEKKFITKKRIPLITFAVGILAFIGSFFGFGNLVNTVYPIFGYIGFIILFIIIYNNIVLKMKHKNGT